MFDVAPPVRRVIFMVIVWAIVFPASLWVSWCLDKLPGPLHEGGMTRSATLTAILVLAMDLWIVPRLEQTMSRLFPKKS